MKKEGFFTKLRKRIVKLMHRCLPNFQKEERKKLFLRLRVRVIRTVFWGLFFSDLVCFGIFSLLIYNGVIHSPGFAPLVWLLLIFLSSTLLGTVVSLLYTFAFIRPLEKLTEATKQVADGDFSARVTLDAESVMAKTEFGVLADSFNRMTSELANTELFRSDFISDFSHEFKTPIISIRGFAKQLMDEDLGEEQRREFAKIIFEESEVLAGMSANILLLTKLEHQEIVSEKTSFSLDEQLRRAVLLFEEQWSALGLHLHLELDEVTCYANEEMLSCVWTNLISNAVKFSKPDGALYIACKENDDTVQVTVRDSGIGMDEETLARIFEKFYQGDTSHAKKGNGLGLALVRRILDLSGGGITVESTKDFGTTFVVTLPKA